MARPTTLKICFVIAALSTVAAATSYAAESTVITGPIQIGGGTFSPSNKVSINALVGPSGCDPSTATTCQQYAAKSKHASGDRIMSTNSSDPKIYYKTVTTATTLEAADLTESFTDPANWTAM